MGIINLRQGKKNFVYMEKILEDSFEKIYKLYIECLNFKFSNNKYASLIESYRLIIIQIARANLFSENENIKEVPKEYIKYLLVDYHLIKLLFQSTVGNRIKCLEEALERLKMWLEQMLSMNAMDSTTRKMFEGHFETKNPSHDRFLKIENYKRRK